MSDAFQLTPLGQALAEANRGLAGTAAKKFRVGVLSFEEMVSAGFVGVCRGVALYNPGRGCALSTYLAAAAKGEIYQEFRRHGRCSDRLVRESARDPGLLAEVVADAADVDVDRPEMLRRLHEAIRALPGREREIVEGRLRKETLEAIGRRLGITKERVRQIEQRARDNLTRIVRGGCAV